MLLTFFQRITNALLECSTLLFIHKISEGLFKFANPQPLNETLAIDNYFFRKVRLKDKASFQIAILNHFGDFDLGRLEFEDTEEKDKSDKCFHIISNERLLGLIAQESMNVWKARWKRQILPVSGSDEPWQRELPDFSAPFHGAH